MRFFFFYTILLFRQVHQEEEFAGGNLSVSRSGSQSLLLNKRLISLVEQKTKISFNLRLNNLPEATIIKALHQSCFGQFPFNSLSLIHLQ